MRIGGKEIKHPSGSLINTEFDTVAGQLAINISGTCQQFVRIHHIGTFLLSYKTVNAALITLKKGVFHQNENAFALQKKNIRSDHRPGL